MAQNDTEEVSDEKRAVLGWLFSFPDSRLEKFKKLRAWFISGWRNQRIRAVIISFILGILAGYFFPRFEFHERITPLVQVTPTSIPEFARPYINFFSGIGAVPVSVQHNVLKSYEKFKWKIELTRTQTKYSLEGAAFLVRKNGEICLLPLTSNQSVSIEFLVPKTREGDRLIAAMSLRASPSDSKEVTLSNFTNYIKSSGIATD